MRTTILDPFETENPSSGQYLGIKIASHSEFQNFDDFCTNSGSQFPFSKIKSATKCQLVETSKIVNSIGDIFSMWIDEIPSLSCECHLFSNGWNQKDFAYFTVDKFVRIAWATTA